MMYDVLYDIFVLDSSDLRASILLVTLLGRTFRVKQAGKISTTLEGPDITMAVYCY